MTVSLSILDKQNLEDFVPPACLAEERSWYWRAMLQ
jgi:hypothetical protein